MYCTPALCYTCKMYAPIIYNMRRQNKSTDEVQTDRQIDRQTDGQAGTNTPQLRLRWYKKWLD